MLGVSQVELENGYYMVDLAELMKHKRKHHAVSRLDEALLRLATNNRAFDEAEAKKYMRQITDSVGIKKSEKFDRSAMEQLRAFTNMGGNKAK